MTTRILPALLAGMLFLTLAGCSSQSVSDFTPSPAAQGTVSLSVMAEPAEFAVGSATIHLTEIQAFIGLYGTSVSGSTARNRVAANAVAHVHETGSESETAATGATGGGLSDPNRDTPDTRPLVEEQRRLGAPRRLVEHQSLGAFVLKAETPLAWTLGLEAGPLDDGQTAALRVKGTIHLPTGDVPLSVLVDEPLSISFAGGQTLRAQEQVTQVLVLQADRWFEGLDLPGLAAKGPVTIDDEQADLLHTFRANLAAGTGVENALHHEHE